MTRSSLSRRRFVGALAAAPLILTAAARGDNKKPANDRLTVGFIGIGVRARDHLRYCLNRGDVQVVAVCDVVKERREDGKKRVEDHYAKNKKGEYKGCAALTDFRELLALKDLDAVVISTPDHWHAIPCVLAARAGKHIYCEKPLTLTIAEGRAVVNAAKKANVVFQTGSQQRSEYGGKFRQAAELVRNGRIGEVKTVHVGVGDAARPCDLAEEPVPEGTDWDFWNGPSPKRGYSSVLCPKGLHNFFPAWRNYREYANGALADMGAHHFDIAQWALDMDGSGPVKIEPPEGKANRGLKFTYAGGVEMYHGGPSGCTFVGSNGFIYVDRDVILSRPESILKEPLGKDAKLVYHATDHFGNWLECVRSRKETICAAEVGHRSASVCMLANIGYWLRRPLRWDPKEERFAGDDEANKQLAREMRAPWKL
ncbi:MAG TPA: Gfo/Idh/MocA family oxidoreductase [Gemmataceae bacterium]|nr:Gfo/Idh/MocA family oxidoreductase [Gemmataceae bacterium]